MKKMKRNNALFIIVYYLLMITRVILTKKKTYQVIEEIALEGENCKKSLATHI